MPSVVFSDAANHAVTRSTVCFALAAWSRSTLEESYSREQRFSCRVPPPFPPWCMHGSLGNPCSSNIGLLVLFCFVLFFHGRSKWLARLELDTWVPSPTLMCDAVGAGLGERYVEEQARKFLSGASQSGGQCRRWFSGTLPSADDDSLYRLMMNAGTGTATRVRRESFIR